MCSRTRLLRRTLSSALDYAPKRERADLFTQFAADPAGQELAEVTRKLGRPPLPSEFDRYPALLLRFGSRSRIDRLVMGLLNPQTLAEAKDAKRNEILTLFRNASLARIASSTHSIVAT